VIPLKKFVGRFGKSPLDELSTRPTKRLKHTQTIFWVLLITGLGAVLRLAAFGSLPVGLYQDEAFNGLDALRVLAGEHPLYFTANNGREPLFIYLASVSIAGLGRTPAAVRLPAALLGTLTIPATAALGSSLFNRRGGLLASALVAVAFWPLHLSRVAFRAVGLPLFVALALAAGWHGARRGNRGWLLAGGALYGLAFYTYLPIYFTLPVLALLALYLWAMGYRSQLRHALPWFAFGATLSLAPLAFTALADPSLLFGRTGQVSLLNPTINQGDLWGALLRQTGRGLGMFFWRGDTIPRHNLPGRPVFDPLIAPFFLLGVFWAGWNWRRPAAALMLLWTALMLAPTILAEDAPHFLRAVGVLPMACLLPAVGLEQAGRWAAHNRIGRRLATVLTALILAASLGITLQDYFVCYAADPLAEYAFQGAAVDLAEEINNSEGSVWASERFMREWESVLYLTGERGVQWVAEDAVPQITTLPAALFIWPYEPVEPQMAALPSGISIQGWRGPLVKGDLESDAYPLYWAYRLESAPSDRAEPVARFKDGIRLEDIAITPPAVRHSPPATRITLYWTTEKKLAPEYTIFVHIEDAAGIVAQDDSTPAAGTLPTSWWRPGDWIVDTHLISMPSPYNPDQHNIVVGLYRNDNRERLAVLDPAGRIVGDAVTLSPGE